MSSALRKAARPGMRGDAQSLAGASPLAQPDRHLTSGSSMALKNQTGFPARPLSGVADRFWTRSIEIGADSRDGRAESSYRLSIDPNGHFLRPGNEGERIVLRRQARAREALDRAAVGLRPEDAQALHAQDEAASASGRRRLRGLLPAGRAPQEEADVEPGEPRGSLQGIQVR